MSVETQALRFFAEAQDRGFTKFARGIEGVVGRLEKRMKELSKEAGKGGGFFDMFLFGGAGKGAGLQEAAISGTMRGFGVALRGVDQIVKSGIDTWSEHTLQVLQFRRQMGLGVDEIRSFNTELISSATRYGMALESVNAIVRSVGVGSADSREAVAKLATQMSQFSFATGTSADTVGDLTRMFASDEWKTLGLPPQNVALALRQAAKYTGGLVTTEQMIQSLLRGQEDLGEFLGTPWSKKAVEQYIDLAAAIGKTTGRLDHAEAMFRAISNPETPLGAQFRAAGADLKVFAAELGGVAETADQAYGSFQAWARELQVDHRALRAFLKSQHELGNQAERFREIMELSGEEVGRALEKSLDPLQRMDRLWNKVKGHVVTIVNSAVEGLLPAIDMAGEALDKLDKKLQPEKLTPKEVQAGAEAQLRQLGALFQAGDPRGESASATQEMRRRRKSLYSVNPWDMHSVERAMKKERSISASELDVFLSKSGILDPVKVKSAIASGKIGEVSPQELLKDEFVRTLKTAELNLDPKIVEYLRQMSESLKSLEEGEKKKVVPPPLRGVPGHSPGIIEDEVGTGIY